MRGERCSDQATARDLTEPAVERLLWEMRSVVLPPILLWPFRTAMWSTGVIERCDRGDVLVVVRIDCFAQPLSHLLVKATTFQTLPLVWSGGARSLAQDLHHRTARKDLRNQGLLKCVERILHAIANQIETMPGGAQCQALGRWRSQRLQSAHVVRADDPQQTVVISCLTATASAENLSKTLKGKMVP